MLLGLPMLLGTSLLGSVLTRSGAIRAGESTVRAGEKF